MNSQQPCIQTHKTVYPWHLPKSLYACKYVFVRNDTHKSLLTHPYRGPYAILECNSKAYHLSIARGSNWVSIDRLKPAYLEKKDSTPTTTLTGGLLHLARLYLFQFHPQRMNLASSHLAQDGPSANPANSTSDQPGTVAGDYL